MAVGLVDNAPRYVGLSTDTKPSGIPVGARFFETDTGLSYVYDGTSWSVVKE